MDKNVELLKYGPKLIQREFFFSRPLHHLTISLLCKIWILFVIFQNFDRKWSESYWMWVFLWFTENVIWLIFSNADTELLKVMFFPLHNCAAKNLNLFFKCLNVGFNFIILWKNIVKLVEKVDQSANELETPIWWLSCVTPLRKF